MTQTQRILLLNPPHPERVNRDYYCGHITKGRYYWPALDLLVLSGVLSQRCEVRFLDAIVEELSEDEALRRVEAYAPDAVVSLAAAVSWGTDMAFCARVQERTRARIVLSGDYPRAQATSVLHSCPHVDAIILDFSDSEIEEYLCGSQRSGLRNLYTRDDTGDPQITDARTFSIPTPRHDLLDLRRYHLPHILHHPFTLLMTDYGCPFHCGFCFFERIRHKRREMANVEQELRFIHSLGVRELMMTEASFGSIRPHTRELCRVLNRTGGRWSWLCDMRVDAANDELFREMKAAGCHTIMFGVETPNQEVLDKHHKGTKVEQIREAFALAKRHRLRTLAHFIIGLTGEDRESLGRLIDFSIALDPDIASFNVAAPAWNTSFRDEVVASGWESEADVEIADSESYPVWETPELPREEIWRLRNVALRRFYMRPSYMLRQLGSIRTAYQFRTVAREGWHMIRQCIGGNPKSETRNSKQVHNQKPE